MEGTGLHTGVIWSVSGTQQVAIIVNNIKGHDREGNTTQSTRNVIK